MQAERKVVECYTAWCITKPAGFKMLTTEFSSADGPHTFRKCFLAHDNAHTLKYYSAGADMSTTPAIGSNGFERYINPLTPKLNPSAQRCLTRNFYWGFCFLNRAFR
jgi:hypothetical protein